MRTMRFVVILSVFILSTLVFSQQVQQKTANLTLGLGFSAEILTGGVGIGFAFHTNSPVAIFVFGNALQNLQGYWRADVNAGIGFKISLIPNFENYLTGGISYGMFHNGNTIGVYGGLAVETQYDGLGFYLLANATIFLGGGLIPIIPVFPTQIGVKYAF
ncbi:MAG: hypothetical protein N2Z58_02370 [Fervidobacterium sp.]|nr:hypothetical protein [Fervidobacterium sp.]